MTTTFCTNCGAPLDTPFCSECGTPAPKVSAQAIDATVVRSAPLVPAWVEFPPPPMVIADTDSFPRVGEPEPTVGLRPLYAPTAPAVVAPSPVTHRRTWLALGAVAALIAGAVTAFLALHGGSSDRASGPASPVSVASAAATLSLPPVSASSAPDPGTRSALVPAWANKNVGRLVAPQMVLGASGTAVFASQGHNTCAVVEAEVTCVATPLWHKDDAAALPPTDPTCSTSADGQWAVFTLGTTGMGTVASCTSTPAALSLGTGIAPHNKVIGMGSTGILCYIDVRKGAPTSQTGVACWNPASNHGFVITNQDKRLW